MAPQRKTKTPEAPARVATIEVRGYAWGREQFPPSHFATVEEALTFTEAELATRRGLICFLETGDLIEDVFIRNENGIALRITQVLRSVPATAVAS